jgi:hypothetical protein
VLSGVTLGAHDRLVNRLWGGANLLFSALQLVGGALLFVTPEPTMLTKVGGGALVLHGADSGQAAARQMWTGLPTEDLTQQAGESVARHIGASPRAAYLTGVGLDVAVPLAVSLGLGAERILAIRAGRISLAAEEAEGGHTILKHVGQTEADLRARLVREPRIPAAGTFSSLRAAEDVISDAISKNDKAIKAWAQWAKQGDRYRVLYTADRTVGTGVVRATGALQRMNKVRIILQKTQVGSRVYFILTAYPEP